MRFVIIVIKALALGVIFYFYLEFLDLFVPLLINAGAAIVNWIADILKGNK